MGNFTILCFAVLVASIIAGSDGDTSSDSPLERDSLSNDKQNDGSFGKHFDDSDTTTSSQNYDSSDTSTGDSEMLDVDNFDTVNSASKFGAYEQHSNGNLTTEQPNPDQTDQSNVTTDQQTASDETTDTDDISTDQSIQPSDSIADTSADPTEQLPISTTTPSTTSSTTSSTTTPSTAPSTVTTTASTDKPTHQTPQPVKAANENPEDSYRKNVIVWVSGFALCCLVILVLVLLYHARRSSPTDHLP